SARPPGRLGEELCGCESPGGAPDGEVYLSLTAVSPTPTAPPGGDSVESGHADAVGAAGGRVVGAHFSRALIVDPAQSGVSDGRNPGQSRAARPRETPYGLFLASLLRSG